MPKDPCQPIRTDIDEAEKELRELRDVLSEVPSGLKPTIRNMIKRKQTELLRLKRALKACEAARNSA